MTREEENNKKQKKGFSLIELSIVLIIIGLLVSGIVGGASLIKSAELRSIMNEARNYRMAVNSYYVSQDALPGDDNTESNGTANDAITTDEGDVNGKIEALNKNSVIEGTEAWNDMSGSNVGVLEMATIFPFPSVTTNRVPPLQLKHMANSKHKGAGWTLDYATTPASGFESTATINANVLILTGVTVMTPTGQTAPVELIPGVIISGKDVFAIDNKADNGNLLTGKIFGIDGENGTPGTFAGDCLFDGVENLCGIAFKIGF